MVEVEHVVALRESSGVMAAVNRFRPDDEENAVTLISAIRWVMRRVKPVHAALRAFIGLFPLRFAGVEPEVIALRSSLGTSQVLPSLRAIADAHIRSLPPPLGFGPRPQARRIRHERFQQQTGPDPPRETR